MRVRKKAEKNFMKHTQMNFARSLKIYLFVFLALLTTCSNPKSSAKTFPITEEERAWLKGFFRDLLFEAPGAYVLYGKKPMMWYCFRKPPTEEEKAELEAYYASLPEEEKVAPERKRFDFYTHYYKWEKIKERFAIKQYLFGTFPPRLDHGPESLIFINVEMALKTLLEHYDDFRRVLGYDFDPLEAVFDVENRESQFWKSIMNNNMLVGILLGYGRENSWFFDWETKYKQQQSKIGEFLRSLPLINDAPHDILYPDPQHFPLPVFGSYGLYANQKKILGEFKKDQEKIKELYRGRDEVDLALEWLTR
jgi:hypothetical protein